MMLVYTPVKEKTIKKNYRKQQLQELKRAPEISQEPLTNTCVHREGYKNFLESTRVSHKISKL